MTDLSEEWYDRPDVAVLEDGVVFRASSFGGCVYGLALDMVRQDGEYGWVPGEPDEFLRAAMDDSSALEQQAMDQWLDQEEVVGWRMLEHEDLRCAVEVGEFVAVEGTIDYAVEGGGFSATATVEVKVVGERLFEELAATMDLAIGELTGLPLKYRWQCSVYAEAKDRPVVLAVSEKKHGALTGRVVWRMWWPKDAGLATREMMLARAKEVFAAGVRIRESVEQGKGTACPDAVSGCKWGQACSEVKELPWDVEKALTAYLDEKAEADVHAAAAAVHKAVVEEWVLRNGGKGVSRDGAKVTWVEQHVPERMVKAHDRKYLRVGKPRKGQG